MELPEDLNLEDKDGEEEEGNQEQGKLWLQGIRCTDSFLPRIIGSSRHQRGLVK